MHPAAGVETGSGSAPADNPGKTFFDYRRTRLWCPTTKQKIQMKILVTGAKGFVGRNLVSQLHNIRDGKARWYAVSNPQDITVYEYDIDSDPAELEVYCRNADFVYNLAGVNRPKDQEEFMKGNFGFASTLLDTLKKYGNKCPVMISSSIQAALDNPYGESKRAGEELMFRYSEETGAKVLVYRFSNLFGKWCRPNYNSVVATFCNNIAKGLPIQVNDPAVTLNLEYIDDVVDELIGALTGHEHTDGRYCHVPVQHSVTLGHIVELLEEFRDTRRTLGVPDVGDAFTRKLHATYLSYLPEDGFGYPVVPHRRQGPGVGEHHPSACDEGEPLAPQQEREVHRGERQGGHTVQGCEEP